MADNHFEGELPLPPVRTRTSLRMVLGSAMLAFLGGGALIGYLVWNGDLQLPANPAAPKQEAAAAPLASPAPAGSAAPALPQLNQQVAALEARLAAINLQAAAADGNTARAEAMVVMLAARRAIERGAALGYLEGQLQTRFGTARPDAVKTVIAAARQPVTIDTLVGQLDALRPTLTNRPADESTWQRVRRGFSDLFVIHSDASAARGPQDQIERARVQLRAGQVAAAIDTVSALPGKIAAKDWLAAARRYAATTTALDQIEQAALTEPEQLKGANGEAVRQPGPGANPPVRP